MYGSALLPVNCQQRPATGGQLAAVGLVEFKKLVYDSKFTKCPKGMSFVDCLINAADMEPQ
jgi:hypothetical protein